MTWLLNIVYLAAFIAASPWLLYRALTTNRYREGLGQKLFGQVPVPTASAAADQPTIWLHGVSVGEVQLLKPLLEQLRQRYPAARFVLSTTTQTGMDLARKILPNEWLIYYPLDFSWSVSRALQRVKPSLVILGELELWPNFVRLAHQRQIPIAIVNARLSERSFRGYRRLRWLTQSIFAKLTLVTAQDESYAERFRACGVPADRVQVTGSIKFDNVTFDRYCEPVAKLRQLIGLDQTHGKDATVWIMGSTQAPEELQAGRVFQQLQEQHPHLRLIVVPRHPERFESVYRELQSLGLNVVRRSLLEQSNAPEEWRVLLVDSVGELRWWWGLADIAIVGGSFGDRGGQNMLEPAAYGVNVAFGPNTSNFRDISQLLLEHNAAVRLTHLDEIAPWIKLQLADPHAGRSRGSRSQEMVRSHQGALARTCEALQQLLAAHDQEVQ